MVNEIIKIVFTKIIRIKFRFMRASKFKICGVKVFIHSPYRIDGEKNIQIGDRSIFQSGTWLYCLPNGTHDGCLKIGSDCIFGYNNHIAAVKEIVIEDFVLTANNVYISDNIHEYEDINIPIINQPIRFKKSVFIGRGSWIGENVSIIGAKIGRNCVIGANSVVTHDVPDFSVAVGAPAKVIRQYDQKINQWVNRSDLC
jgi:acetyltransferase-like isoleucine patch superfamily enzyme